MIIDMESKSISIKDSEIKKGEDIVDAVLRNLAKIIDDVYSSEYYISVEID